MPGYEMVLVDVLVEGCEGVLVGKGTSAGVRWILVGRGVKGISAGALLVVLVPVLMPWYKRY